MDSCFRRNDMMSPRKSDKIFGNCYSTQLNLLEFPVCIRAWLQEANSDQMVPYHHTHMLQRLTVVSS